MRCSHCPLEPEQLCRGESIRRFCELIDPTHPDHSPDHRSILAGDAVITADADRALMIAKAQFDPDFALVGGCGCG